jgi:hypothetical protein
LRIPEAPPVLVEKDGVLVVQAEAIGDLDDMFRQERNRRVSELVKRVSL